MQILKTIITIIRHCVFDTSDDGAGDVQECNTVQASVGNYFLTNQKRMTVQYTKPRLSKSMAFGREVTGRHSWSQHGATPSRVVGTSETKIQFFLFLPRNRENGYNGGQGRFRYIIQVVWIWLAVRYFLMIYKHVYIIIWYTRDVLCAYMFLTKVLYIYILQ